MLVIDPRIRQMPRTKKPLQHRSLCCSGFLFQQLSINALKIFRLSSFTRNENSGCHCTAQTNLLSGRHTASVSPSSETAIAASPGASVHTSVKNKTEKSCATSLSVVLLIPQRAADCKPLHRRVAALEALIRRQGRIFVVQLPQQHSTAHHADEHIAVIHHRHKVLFDGCL
jgi:hypothetical protein